MSDNPTACLLIIGNEVLSGRTRDANLQFLATGLGEIGIPLREVRVIPDVRATIVETLNAVRARFDHVFTTGGIGPTHDDITSECVAEAFGRPWEPHPEAVAEMAAHYQRQGTEFNAARMRMATMPEGAVLIRCEASAAPGFSVDNVHVMAGVPRIMQSMFAALAPTLSGGAPVRMRAVHADGLLEGRIAAGLEAVQRRFPALDIGSYPYYGRGAGGGTGGAGGARGTGATGGHGVTLVAKGTDPAALAEAAAAMAAVVREAGLEPVEGEPPPAAG